MDKDEERGRVPRARAALLVGGFALFAGSVNLVTIVAWPQESESPSVKLALWSTVLTLGVSVALMVAAGVLRHIERWVSFDASTSGQKSPVDEAPIEKRLDEHADLYHACVGLVVACIGTTVVLTGGPAYSPAAQILIGSFILGQILSPNTKNVWFMLVVGFIAVTICQIGYEVLKTKWWPDGFKNFEVPAATYIAPGLLTAMATTFVNLASVRSRQAVLRSVSDDPPSQEESS